ncbi:ATP-dependent RNA helicase HrpA [Corynebacterium kozikiae]|uniref:ATP-dependent RNA helicase HrpA n=1 Tax=Corynebacterium kozikiae TaxID=2968469 RepID=UPI00211C5B3A|nr:ATP-dependent RNA helicase HrpA [Corynebacterium sp. 76QC2CO]MCQ9342466.1 ATP-dependent RNA helicase HrpA [Corynebacterium sp. 76QC2CO]
MTDAKKEPHSAEQLPRRRSQRTQHPQRRRRKPHAAAQAPVGTRAQAPLGGALKATQKELLSHIEQDAPNLRTVDVRALRRRARNARSNKAFQAIHADLQQAVSHHAEFVASLPEVSYPESLPVSARKDDIAEAIRDHQVVIIAGETGSGKTTQIPKICLELGRGRKGLIGHTQPRRLAARTVAERIAFELEQPIGQTVGYAIRFDDQVGPNTAIKLMTDGILLAEMQRDRFLNAYDTIIIDEAHERSLNIDFLLGYLKQLLPKRPDLKVVITSATIDPERFAEHFAQPDGTPAPIIEVSGRTYPVEVRYRPLEVEVGEKTVDIDPLDGLIGALEELMSEGPGDILCFFAGEADIRDAMEVIQARRYKNVEVTPLFGRLSNQEQHKVFSPHSGRRIVLATNIAETSLTVPGIHYVVDTGTARISRYSTRTKVQRLPVEPISQASANQRSGRCGRVADGIAIRLYSEEDFSSRPEFTDPEILRTNLASVILQMASLRLGDIEAFPFLQAPDTKAIRDGLLLLHELGALDSTAGKDGEPRLTKVGRDIARVPLDPRLARMLLEANTHGVLGAVYVIVAALSIQDVRERPLEMQAQADQAHARFKDPNSDFLSLLKLWEHIVEERGALSGNAFKRSVQKQFLHYMRIREWFDLVRQLRNIGDQLGWADPMHGLFESLGDVESQADLIHRALLSGLLSQIGIRDAQTKEFQGTRNTRFMIFPGSALAKKPPQFLMAAQLVETSRLWARDVASIDPRWVEQLGKDLLKHQYSEPFWSTKRGSAMAHQRSTLYGVPVVADRVVGYHTIDPQAARDMFLREALIDGNWNTHHEFFHNNTAKLELAGELEEKARRRDIVVDEQALFDFYDARIPQEVFNANTFHSWWKKQQGITPNLLDFDPAELLTEHAEDVHEDAFPDSWTQNGVDFELTYKFEPGTVDDGVTVRIPVPLLGSVRPEGFEWNVPGLREELVAALIKTLPKHLRRQVVPAPDYAKKVAANLRFGSGDLLVQVANELVHLGGSGITEDDFSLAQVPDHLKVSFGAVDKRGDVIDRDKDLLSLQQRFKGKISTSMAKVGPKQQRATEWTSETLGTIAEEVITKVDGQNVIAYPTLAVGKTGVAVEVVSTKAQAEAQLFTATMTLMLREVKLNAQKMLNGLPLQQRVALEHFPNGGAQGFIADATAAAVRDILRDNGGPSRDPARFRELLSLVKEQAPGVVRRTTVDLAPSVLAFHQLNDELQLWSGPAIDDMRAQVAGWLPQHAITRLGVARLRHIPRFAQAIRLRLEDLQRLPDRDARYQQQIQVLQQRLAQKVQASKRGVNQSQVLDIQWMIEELRVSLFAQRLGTAQKVSERKIEKAIDQLK